MKMSELLHQIDGLSKDDVYSWERAGYIKPKKIRTRKGRIQRRDYSNEFKKIKLMWHFCQKGFAPRNASNLASDEIKFSGVENIQNTNNIKSSHRTIARNETNETFDHNKVNDIQNSNTNITSERTHTVNHPKNKPQTRVTQDDVFQIELTDLDDRLIIQVLSDTRDVSGLILKVEGEGGVREGKTDILGRLIFPKFYYNGGFIEIKVPQEEDAKEKEARALFAEFLQKAKQGMDENLLQIFINENKDKLSFYFIDEVIRNVELVLLHDVKFAFWLAVVGVLIAHDINDKSSEARAFLAVGNVYGAMGQPLKALSEYERAREIFEHEGSIIGMADTWMNAGIAFSHLGEYEKSHNLLTLSRDQYRENGFEIKEAIVAHKIGNLLCRYLNVQDKAIQYYDDSITILKRHGHDIAMAKVIVDKANAYMTLGYTENTLKLYQESEDIFVSKGIKNSLLNVRLNKAMLIATHFKNYTEAIKLLNETKKKYIEKNNDYEIAEIDQRIAIILLEQNNYEESMNLLHGSLNVAIKYNNFELKWIVLAGLGYVFEKMGKYKEAINKYEESVKTIETIRSNSGSQDVNIWFLSNKISVYDRVIDLCINRGDIEKSLEYIEKVKSRTLSEKIQNPQSESNAKEERSTNISYTIPSLSIKDIIDKLPKDMAIIEYYYYGDNLRIFVISKKGIVKAINNKMKKERMIDIEKNIRFLLFGKINEKGERINHPIIYQTDELNKVNTYLSYLYDTLIRPIEEHLHDIDKIMIIPHGILHFIPFSALYDGKQYIIDKYTVSHALTIRSVGIMNHKKKPGGIYSCISIGSSGSKLHRLEFSEMEAVEIAKIFGENGEKLTGNKCTKKQIIDKIKVNTYDIVHFSCHAHVCYSNSIYSYLLVGNEECAEKIYISDLLGLSNNADLVTLSACDTGLCPILPGDELVGFERAFFLMGTKSLLTTLWNISDSPATRDFMRAFYSCLKNEQQGKAYALRKAIRWLKEAYEHPLYWAPFRLVGEYN